MRIFEKDIFDCKALGVGVKGEWNFAGFLVRSLVRFLGRNVCLWLQRSQGSRVF